MSTRPSGRPGQGTRPTEFLARRRPSKAEGAGAWAWWLWPLAVDLADGRADLPRYVARLLRFAVVIVLVAGCGSALVVTLALVYLGVDVGTSLRAGFVALAVALAAFAVAAVNLLCMKLAPRATAAWWARRHWDTEVTLRLLAIVFTRRTWKQERDAIAQQLDDLGDLRHTITETRAASTWDLRTVEWDNEREARKRATALVLQAIERAWVVRHRDKPLPPMPRVISGGRTPRGVALEVEWPGGGHAGVLEELQAELASVWHVDATTGVVVDRTGRPGNRAGVSLNYVDPFAARAASPLTEEDDDAEDPQ